MLLCCVYLQNTSTACQNSHSEFCLREMESVGLILLIPFFVCFLLLFIVCCFADEIKKMCRMPNQLPQHYIPSDRAEAERERRRRQRRQRQARAAVHGQRPSESDVESLMGSRSRNSSGSSGYSSEICPFQVIAVVTSEVQPNGEVITSHVDAQSLLQSEPSTEAGLSASQTIMYSIEETGKV